MEIDEILADIITHDLTLDPKRVILYSQNYYAPKDNNMYVIISTRQAHILANTNNYNKNDNTEIKGVVSFSNLDIDITSKSREAMERKEEVIMALTSCYSLQIQEQYQIRIFRNNNILDLSFIEGGSALHRYRISVTISNIKTKITIVDYFDKFPKEEKIS